MLTGFTRNLFIFNIAKFYIRIRNSYNKMLNDPG